jgi:TolR protein
MAPHQVGSAGEAGYRPLAEINITPLVDVMLVLLIIFMVAAPLMAVGVPVQLPKTNAAKIAQPRAPIIVTIDSQGQVFLRDKLVPDESIGSHLAELAREQADAVVYVRGDRSLSYGRIMEVMGVVSTAGFAKVSLIAQGASSAAAKD